MTTHTLLLGLGALTISPVLRGQALDNAEVRIPYGELKQLLARAVPPAKPETPKPALLAARLRLSLENGRPVIDAVFRATSFSGEVALIPLLGGDLSLEKQDPEDAVLVVDGNSLCLAADRAGIRTLQLRLLPIIRKNRFSLTLPVCPSVIFETGDLPADQSVVLGSGTSEEALAAGQVRPLPNTGQTLTISLLDSRETREALRPPEPSTWLWQNQALVMPADGGLIYHISASASAADGSGMEALLPLPSDAQDVTATGDDLVSQTKIRGENRALGMQLVWKTRGILDRQVTLAYRLPLRPLDRAWHLQAPGGAGTRTRFIIATSPVLAYAADGLTPPLAAQGLPAVLAESLHGAPCQHLEATTTADLTVTPIPVAATADGVVTTAEWALKIEPDGAMLVTGVLAIEHKSQLGFVLDTPPGMKLLSCEVAGKEVSPVDLGEGVLQVTLPPQAEGSRLSCAFTGRTTALDPVEGTVSLALPKVPLFMHALLWQLDLPAGYQAETHGNLMRQQVAPGAPPSRITLKKNLCRDERPEIQLFYQRSDLKL
jgi:hypothetical protein